MKTYGVTGATKGKIGSLLVQRANFVNLDCDITVVKSIETAIAKAGEHLDIIVNCAAISSVDECEKDFKRATKVNIRGLHNLHQVFGGKVLNISSDHVFSGDSWFLPDEKTIPNPINAYGFSKFGAETISGVDGGKTIRLSRVVSSEDLDISYYLRKLSAGEEIEVPTFLKRNYIHRDFVVNGIEYFVRNWDKMPSTVNYAGMNNESMFTLMDTLSKEMGKEFSYLVGKRREYNTLSAPRPKWGGFNVDLARKLGFPMYSLLDTVARLARHA